MVGKRPRCNQVANPLQRSEYNRVRLTLHRVSAWSHNTTAEWSFVMMKWPARWCFAISLWFRLCRRLLKCIYCIYVIVCRALKILVFRNVLRQYFYLLKKCLEDHPVCDQNRLFFTESHNPLYRINAHSISNRSDWFTRIYNLSLALYKSCRHAIWYVWITNNIFIDYKFNYGRVCTICVHLMSQTHPPTSDTYMRQWIGSVSVHIMACPLLGAMPSSKPTLCYCRLHT